MEQHPLTGIRAVAPSVLQVGETFALKLKCLTTPHYQPATCCSSYPRIRGPFNLSPRGINYMDNVADRWSGPLVFTSTGELSGPPEITCDRLAGAFPGDTRALGCVPGFSFREPGTYTIRVTDPRTGITTESNPVEVTADDPPFHLFWGDLHSQTYFSDGLRVPEELYHFAHHEGFLDIFALADHSEFLTGAQWEYFTRVTNDFYRPGRYVTFVGLEWTNSAIGHRNVYYPGDHGPILRYNDETGDNLQKLYAAASRHGGLVIPHHSANVTMGVDWDTLHDPEHVRLVEIYSVWGNSERPATAGNTRPIRTLGGEEEGRHVLDALARGYTLGFVGGGDIHDGRPGDELHTLQDRPAGYRQLHRQGIMGVWARELTREAIWEALWNRRVFATTNVRIILRFEVCGAPMGQTTTAAGPRRITLHAATQMPIEKVEIVKNGRDLFTATPGTAVADLDFEDAAADTSDYYYARVTRSDGEMAWSSPVWVVPASVT